MMSHRCSAALLSALLLCAGPATYSNTGVRTATAFVPPPSLLAVPSSASSRLAAGGFEWEDPTDQFDQGVENPYKNPDILKKKDGDNADDAEGKGGGEEGEMKIDPARLLGPRLQGSNLYFVGMMGSGKSAVGDIVARSELTCGACGALVFVLVEVALVSAYKMTQMNGRNQIGYVICCVFEVWEYMKSCVHVSWHSLRSLLTTFLTTYPKLE